MPQKSGDLINSESQYARHSANHLSSSKINLKCSVNLNNVNTNLDLFTICAFRYIPSPNFPCINPLHECACTLIGESKSDYINFKNIHVDENDF